MIARMWTVGMELVSMESTLTIAHVTLTTLVHTVIRLLMTAILKGVRHRVLQTASVLTKWVVSSVYANQIIPADCAILALITVWVWSALVPRPCVWMRSIHSDVTAKKDSLERTVTFPQSLLRETVILVFHKVSQSEKTTTTT